MNKEKLELIRETIRDLDKKHLTMLSLEIVYEMDCQLEEELTEEDYDKLYNEIEYVYLKVDDIDLGTIVRCAIDHIRRILDNDETFDLREEVCWY